MHGKGWLQPARRAGGRSGRAIGVGVATLALLGSLGGSALAHAKAVPAITSFSAKPGQLSSSGGTVNLAAVVTNATNCKFTGPATVTGLPATLNCVGGSAASNVTLPANTSTAVKTYTFNLKVTSGRTSVNAAPVTVVVAPPAAPTIKSFAAVPAQFSSTGGTVGLSTTVGNATTCTFSSSPKLAGLPDSVDCSSGSGGSSVLLPTNTTGKPKIYTFKLVVKGVGPTATATATAIVQPPNPPSISLFEATPPELNSAGGSIGLSATVADASTCTFSSSPAVAGLPTTVSCASGSAGHSVTLPANTTKKAKTYVVKLVAKGVGPNAIASDTVTVDPPGTTAPGVVHVTGTLTGNTIWGPQQASVYVIDPVEVPDGVTLTIEPGTIIKTTSGVGVDVNGGTLDVVGTAANPVVFTSYADDSVGGDTNGDGPSAGAPGGWGGLVVRDEVDPSNSSGPTLAGGHINLTYARILYATTAVSNAWAGFCAGPCVGQLSTVALDHVEVSNASSYGMNLASLTSISLTNSSFSNDTLGPKLVETGPSGQDVVSGNTFLNTVSSTALDVESDVTPVVENNAISGNGSTVCNGCTPTLVVASPALDLNQLTGNAGGGNAGQSVGLSGTLITTGSFSVLPTDWTPEILQTLTVAPSVILTIPAGTDVKTQPCFNGACPYANGLVVDGGTLNAVGTATSQITFTSIDDNTVGGTTGSGTPQPGGWGGLVVRDEVDPSNSSGPTLAGGHINLTYARILYATTAVSNAWAGFCAGPCVGQLSTVALDHVEVSNASSYGMNLASLTSISLTNSSFSNDTLGPKLVETGPSGQDVVSGNTFLNTVSSTALDVESDVTPVVENNAISGNGSTVCNGCTPTLVVASPALDLNQLTGNAGGGNAGQLVGLSGTLITTGSFSVLPTDWTPEILQTLTVAPSVILTIPAGTDVKTQPCFNGACPYANGLVVDGGTLNAVGTATSQITFTSIDDNTVGGTTGSGTPQPGGWGGLVVKDAADAQGDSGRANVDLEHVRERYADTAVMATTLGKITVAHDRFSSNTTAVEIVAGISPDQLVSTNASVVDNDFEGNQVALTGDSNWIPAETGVAGILTVGCHYLPEMDAGGNIFDGYPAGTVLMASSDYGAMQVWLAIQTTTQSPNDWTNSVETGPSDVVTYHANGCVDYPDPQQSHAVIASPFDFSQAG